MQQQRGIFAAAARIGAEQGLELDALIAGARIGIGQGTSGADRGAGAAAHAQIGIDLDLLTAAVAADGRRRADVDAGMAAGFFIAAVGAQFLFVDKKLGLLKLTHQRTQFHQRLGVPAIPAQVALGQGMLGEGRRGAQVKHQIKRFAGGLGLPAEINRTRHLARRDAGPVRLTQVQVNLVIQADGSFRARHQAGIATCAQVQINRVAAQPLELKGAQPASQRLNLATEHRVTPLLGGAQVPRALREQGDVKFIRQQFGGTFGGAQLANDQQAPGALVRDGGHRLRLRQMRRRQQGRNFRAGLGGITAPATGLADVHEMNWRDRALGLLRQLGKQPFFLGAGHDHVVARLDRLEKSARLAAAQGGMQGQGFIQCCAQALGVQRHGLVAIAYQCGHGLRPALRACSR